jgi:hypothetical protein
MLTMMMPDREIGSVGSWESGATALAEGTAVGMRRGARFEREDGNVVGVRSRA